MGRCARMTGKVARLAIGLAIGVAFVLPAAAASFYLFPVQEIEGMSAEGQKARRMLDPGVMARLFGDKAGQQAQAALVTQFVNQLHGAYPDSLIHARQVADNNIGQGHRFVNEGSLQCRAAPSFKVADTYAVVLAVQGRARRQRRGAGAGDAQPAVCPAESGQGCLHDERDGLYAVSIQP
jgi:hypothetical protein